MIKLTNRNVIVVAAFSLALMTLVSSAQDRRLAYDDWYGDVKKTLADHYTGKTVKLRMAIPDTRRGLEVFDGTIANGSETNPTQALANPGDELTIKSFKVGDQNIEFRLIKIGEKPKRRFFNFAKQPRINIRFSRELNSTDMTIENINRWLSPMVDVNSLGGVLAEQTTSSTQASITPSPDPVAHSNGFENQQGLPTPSISGNLGTAEPDVSELTVECSTANARVYIDDAYSGFAPRTVRLKSGIHSILVMADGYSAWEQRLFLPGGKTSTVKPELKK